MNIHENIDWKMAGIVIGIIISLSTIMSWKFAADSYASFQTKEEATKMETRITNSLLEIKSDIREVKFDLKEFLKIR